MHLTLKFANVTLKIQENLALLDRGLWIMTPESLTVFLLSVTCSPSMQKYFHEGDRNCRATDTNNHCQRLKRAEGQAEA